MRNMTAAEHSLDHQGADGSWNPSSRRFCRVSGMNDVQRGPNETVDEAQDR